MMVCSATRNKTRRQWVSQYDVSDYTFPTVNTDVNSKKSKTSSFHLPSKSNHFGNDSDHDPDIPDSKSKFASCLGQYKLNRKRTLLWTVVIVIVTLNGLQFQFFGLPARLQSYYTNSYTGNNNNHGLNVEQQTLLRDRNLGGCGEMTAEENRSLRNRNLGGCEKTAYITSTEAATFVSSLENSYNNSNNTQPAHITLCKELIKRNAEAENQDEESKSVQNPFLMSKIKTNGLFEVHESQDVCTDWERPHSSLQQIISSSIVAHAGSRFDLKYKHNCYTTMSSHTNLDFDVTTAQQIFPANPMPFDENKLSLGEVVFNLCQSCIDQENNSDYIARRKLMYENNIEDTHHCFLFPERGEVHMGNVQEDDDFHQEILDENNQIVNTALDAALTLVRNRLYHASIDWAPRSRIPSNDPRAGAVIYLDAAHSLPIPFYHFRSHIEEANHVSIISSPRCSESILGNINCFKYGSDLQRYLQNYFNKIEVSFDLVSSTAVAYSRMIQSHILLCPPGSITCLFPALAREVTKKTIIFESIDERSTFHWFSYLANSRSMPVSIMIVTLTHIDLQFIAEQQNEDTQFRSVSGKEVIKLEGDKPSTSDTTLPESNKGNRDVDNVDSAFNRVQRFDFNKGKMPVQNAQELDRSGPTGHDKLVIALPTTPATVTEEENNNMSYGPLVIQLPVTTDYPDVGIVSTDSDSSVKSDIEEGISPETIMTDSSVGESLDGRKSSNTIGEIAEKGEVMFNSGVTANSNDEVVFDNTASNGQTKVGNGEVIFDKIGK